MRLKLSFDYMQVGLLLLSQFILRKQHPQPSEGAWSLQTIFLLLVGSLLLQLLMASSAHTKRMDGGTIIIDLQFFSYILLCFSDNLPWFKVH